MMQACDYVSLSYVYKAKHVTLVDITTHLDDVQQDIFPMQDYMRSSLKYLREKKVHVYSQMDIIVCSFVRCRFSFTDGRMQCCKSQVSDHLLCSVNTKNAAVLGIEKKHVYRSTMIQYKQVNSASE